MGDSSNSVEPDGLPITGSDVKVFIIGAGATGLLIAQGLKKRGIQYEVYEQETAAHRPRDWGMAYFWSASYLPDLLPDNLLARLPEAQVDPHTLAKSVETMVVVNIATGMPIREVPSPGGRRVGRRKLRRLLATDIPIQYDHKLATITYDDHESGDRVTAHFQNGATATGTILIGADGGQSAVRRVLFQESPTMAEPTVLPYHMLNFNVRYPSDPAQARFIRDGLIQFVDHGIHPDGVFFLMILQDVPDPDDPTTWKYQVTITYPPNIFPVEDVDPGVKGMTKHVDADPEGRTYTRKIISILKTHLAPRCSEPRKSALLWLTDDPDCTNIPRDRLQIWEPFPWDNHVGRVTLAGDAAHAVSFHRGQGLNNCIRDSHHFVSVIESLASKGVHLRGEMIDAYDKEIIDRGGSRSQAISGTS